MKLYDMYFGEKAIKEPTKPRVTKKLRAAVTKIETALPKRRGRPRSANKLTAAEKQRAYRERQRGA